MAVLHPGRDCDCAELDRDDATSRKPASDEDRPTPTREQVERVREIHQRKRAVRGPEAKPAFDEDQAPCPYCDGTGHGEPLGDMSGYVPCQTCNGTGRIHADDARRINERRLASDEEGTP